ncbi:protein serine/threonine kinase, putative [Entamoeba invadens IP1]|uniref:Protein serine/threonine kinase, putative n=1 Tax=Entamoeba invadens IP1 TaxID=370355 RepID=A0A0A1UAH1_ENTIV|nr:protein serine/threonine kinase, putative [Entamoeba invadens IP1]ELP92022.1 protein serine/threonine kinase, putative [Entamoeba invadens IP1]|eukprot:XP_004258793.1 protein serine/threonine kinase, putative [Entamoeba invadens IP1]
MQDKKHCTQCMNGYYPDSEGECNKCDTLPNCFECDQTKAKCTKCKTGFGFFNGSCVQCNLNKGAIFENETSECKMCYSSFDNCKLCQKTSTNVECVECSPPYSWDSISKTCKLCIDGNYYDKTTKNCVSNNNICTIQNKEDECLTCNNNYFLRNGSCIPFDNCEGDNTQTSSSCECQDTLAINSNCYVSSDESTCKYVLLNGYEDLKKCLSCNDNFTLMQNKVCGRPDYEYNYIRNNANYTCERGMYLSTENECMNCVDSSVCISFNNKIKILECSKDLVHLSDSQQAESCKSDEKCTTYGINECLNCSSKTTDIVKGACVTNPTANCIISLNSKCILCDKETLLSDGNCISKLNFNCLRNVIGKCIQCIDNYYRSTISDIYCENTSKIPNCIYQIIYSNNTMICKECLPNYMVSDSKCVLITSTKLIQSSFKYSDLIKCKKMSTKGCLECEDTYYLTLQNTCEKCDSSCVNCSNTTLCISCPSGFYLTSEHTCKEVGSLHKTCDMLMPNAVGCAICKVGYYYILKDCRQCETSCYSCLDNKQCVSCADNYFRIANETKLCLPFDELTQFCLKKTKNGCVSCQTGYFLSNGRCSKCLETCIKCTSMTYCSECSDNYVNIDYKCHHSSTIQYCTAATNDRCTKCKGWHAPDDSGSFCKTAMRYDIIFVTNVAVVILIILVLVIVVVLCYQINLHNKEKKKMLNVCVYNMKKSNVPMQNLGDFLLSNKQIITFGVLNEDSLIEVNEETRELLCVGNNTNHTIKVQFSVIDNCDQFLIRTEPTLVTLKKGIACEFEIFIKPVCTCNIHSNIVAIALDLETGKQIDEKIEVSAVTKMTTRLDYTELIEAKKLGEGSFGVVYLGEFRGDKVAIKKMKQSSDDKSSKKEFEDEVSMLDKFRSEYIVHFYGAVFIPNKVCLVTEFAQFGSLQDLINNKTSSEIDMKKRLKFMLDVAMGIMYLHENGILHRDIKPDNALIFSLNASEKVNAKLTDFGSSRNINMMMTNMTFTKGVGTPTYMAPEVLKQEKYKKPADIYSFAMTMYECFAWRIAYSDVEFKFPWTIAEFVSLGKRLEKPDYVDVKMYNIIVLCWSQHPLERLKIEEVVSMVREQF